MNIKSDSYVSITDYIIVLLLLQFSGNAQLFFRDIRYSIIPIIIISFIFYHRKKQIIGKDYNIFIIYSLYIFAYYIKYNFEFDPAFSFRVFSYISLAYFTLKLTGDKFFKIYEDLIFMFAAISLPLFMIMAIDYDFLYKIVRGLQSYLGLPLYNMNYASIFIFTLNKGQIRNCGFAWEPGAFSEFLSLGLIIYLARNNFDISRSRFWIITAALLTTFSTTGYLALAVISVWYIFNVPYNKKLILIPFFIFIFIYIIELPFMKEKIIKLSQQPIEAFEKTAHLSRRVGSSYSLGRFAGLIMNIKDFINHPVIGYGGHGELTFAGQRDINIFSINGLGVWLSRYGAIGFMLLVYLYNKSFNYMSKLFEFNKPIFLLGVMFVLGFGFGLLESSLFFTFMLSGYLLEEKDPELKNE